MLLALKVVLEATGLLGTMVKGTQKSKLAVEQEMALHDHMNECKLERDG